MIFLQNIPIKKRLVLIADISICRGIVLDDIIKTIQLMGIENR
jgi:hypothetical protein